MPKMTPKSESYFYVHALNDSSNPTDFFLDDVAVTTP